MNGGGGGGGGSSAKKWKKYMQNLACLRFRRVLFW